jgi:dihydropyrimidine dehydrogenase (NAD+) subunit PreA
MADLSIEFCGVKSPNPFWLASGPPTNTGAQVLRAFEAGWGGVVWKTLGNPIVNVSSRFGGVDYGNTRLVGLNNNELITDRSLDVNLQEIREVKKRFPDRAVFVSLMVETREEWKEIITRVEDAGADGLELNFACPHGMCERGMGSAVGNEPKVLQEIASWAVGYAKTPLIVKLTPNIGDITEPGAAAVRAGVPALSLINSVKSIVGVDLDRMVPLPRIGNASTTGGFCGPAIKPIALHHLTQIARHSECGKLAISGIGGISTWRDAAEFIALGATSVQVCTAVMHYGYRIVEEMIDGLSEFLDGKGIRSVRELRGLALPAYKDWGELDLSYRVVAEVNADRCIGCQLCYVACMDGAHQCIHLPGRTPQEARKAGHVHIPAVIPERAFAAVAGTPASRIPFVDEEECVGCNLCALVCPVPECITMKEVPTGNAPETWGDRVAKGTDLVPGGLEVTRTRREG